MKNGKTIDYLKIVTFDYHRSSPLLRTAPDAEVGSCLGRDFFFQAASGCLNAKSVECDSAFTRLSNAQLFGAVQGTFFRSRWQWHVIGNGVKLLEAARRTPSHQKGQLSLSKQKTTQPVRPLGALTQLSLHSTIQTNHRLQQFTGHFFCLVLVLMYCERLSVLGKLSSFSFWSSMRLFKNWSAKECLASLMFLSLSLLSLRKSKDSANSKRSWTIWILPLWLFLTRRWTYCSSKCTWMTMTSFHPVPNFRWHHVLSRSMALWCMKFYVFEFTWRLCSFRLVLCSHEDCCVLDCGLQGIVVRWTSLNHKVSHATYAWARQCRMFEFYSKPRNQLASVISVAPPWKIVCPPMHSVHDTGNKEKCCAIDISAMLE